MTTQSTQTSIMLKAQERLRKADRRNWDRRLRHAYGISVDDYERILADQGGGCALCGRTDEASGRHLSVEHDHGTGRVRGITCQRCNIILAGIDAIGVDRILAYLKGVKSL